MENRERDQGGRFRDGCGAGPGRPKGSRNKHPFKRLRVVLEEALTDEDLVETWKKVAELAKAGELDAIRYLHDRIYGRDASYGAGMPELELPTELKDHRDLANLLGEVLLRALNGDMPAGDLAKIAAFVGRVGDEKERAELVARLEALEGAAGPGEGS